MDDVYKFKNPQKLNICASVVSNVRPTGGRQDTNTPKEVGSGTHWVHMCLGVLLQVRGSRQECFIFVCTATGM